MAQYTWETCSKVIQSEVNTLQTEIQRLLDQNLIGIYLHGSLALGGFQPERSDIDVIVVTAQKIDLETKRRCIELLLRISRMPCPLDIRFLVQQDLFPFQHPLLCDLHYSETHRESYQQELRSGTWKDWNGKAQRDPDLAVHLMVLHRFEICLYGKPIGEALPPVPERDFRDAIIKDVQVAQGEPLYDPISYILNACRACAYLYDGAILSKDAGGVWGLAHLPEQFHPLIHQALALYRGERLGRSVGHVAWDDFVSYMHEAILM
ncbi:MAG: aminoglycoside adenylyltransferase domain-containing protein [Ktedonobacteraceae bacterium]